MDVVSKSTGLLQLYIKIRNHFIESGFRIIKSSSNDSCKFIFTGFTDFYLINYLVLVVLRLTLFFK